MELTEFAKRQEEAIKETAKGITRLLEINLSYDVEEGIKRCIANNPLLKGVSVSEIARLVLAEGWGA